MSREDNRGSGGSGDGGARCPAALEDRDERDGPDRTWGGRQR